MGVSNYYFGGIYLRFVCLMFIWGDLFLVGGIAVYFEDMFLSLDVLMDYFDVTFLR